jgi:ribosomal protein S18 acetylase RimI-like enzyme
MVRWNAALIDAHARTKYACFRDEIDAIVFPCLGDLEGCRRLMREISNKSGFSPCATWLVARGGTPTDSHQPGASHGGLESQASSRGVLEQASSRGVLEQASSRGVLEWCGTIQGVVDAEGNGSIQNVGVVPSLRGLGLGSCLIEQALAGFQRLGLRRAFLEVTADNKPAVRLYQRLGFRTVRTLYKTVDSPGRSVDQVGHRGEPALL